MKWTTLLLLLSTFMLWSCSVQKRTTQPGWYVESAWLHSTPTAHIQSQATPATTPLSLRRASTLASTHPHRQDLLRLPNRTDVQPEQQLTHSVARWQSGTMKAKVRKLPRLQRRLLEDIHFQPSHNRPHHALHSQPTGQEGEPNDWIHIGIGLALLGIFLMPSPAALIGLLLSTFAFIIGILRGPKNAASPSPDAEPERRRPLLKVFLLLVGMTLATYLVVAAMIMDATSGWSDGWNNPFEGWNFVSW